MQIEHEHSEQDGQHLFNVPYAEALASVSRKTRRRDGSVKRTCYSHAQRSRLLVRCETDDVHPEGYTSVHDQCGRAEPSHLMRAPVPDMVQLPTDPCAKHTLDERQRAHPSQQV